MLCLSMKYWVTLDVVIGDYIVFPTFPCFKLFPLSSNLAVRYKEIYSLHSWYTGVGYFGVSRCCIGGG